MLCQFTGSCILRYNDYLDAATHRMLEAAPGELAVYDVLVAPGRNPGLPLPPGDGRWVAVPFADGGLVPEAAAEDSSDEGDAPGAAGPAGGHDDGPAAAPEFAEPAGPAEPPEPAEPEDGAEAPGPDLPSLPGESTADEPAHEDQAEPEGDAATPEGDE